MTHPTQRKQRSLRIKPIAALVASSAFAAMFAAPALAQTASAADKNDTVKGLTGPLAYSFGNYKVTNQVGDRKSVV